VAAPEAGRQNAPVTDPVELSWQPEVADYLEAFTARNRARGAWRKVGWISGAALVFAVVAFVLGHRFAALYGVEAAVLLPLLLWPITWLSTRSVWHRHPALRAPTRAYVYSAAGISTDAPLLDLSTGQVRVGSLPQGVPWTGVQRVLETKRVFIVQLAPKRFLLLAKRGLADPAGLDVLTRHLQVSPSGSR
jgi:hypothetical protein